MKKRMIAGMRRGGVFAVMILLNLGVFSPMVLADSAASSLAVKNGDKIAFMGDSITAG
jgi:hypothetical protein